VWSAPLLPADVVDISFPSRQPVLYVLANDSSIERELQVSREQVAWLTTSGAPVAARARSAPFYIPQGKSKVTIELPFTHNADISIHRYHGDWLSLAAGDAVLQPDVTAGWAAWPAGMTLLLASNPVTAGSYSLDMLQNAAGALIMTNPHAGWYRLDSTAAADKTLNVSIERV
jgi:hypothetical protein